MNKSGDLIRAIDLEGISEAAKRLGVTRQRVYQMIEQGVLEAYLFGKRKLVHKRDVDRLIQQRNRKRAS